MYHPTRGQFLASSVAGAGALRLPHTATAKGPEPRLQGQAEHVISIWLGGGMGQIDTFDPPNCSDE